MRVIVTIIIMNLSFLAAPNSMCQTHRQKGLRENPVNIYAFTNAFIVSSPQQSIENGTIVIRDGIIEDIGENIEIPADAKVIDAKGKYIYPGFIEMYSSFGLPTPKEIAETANSSGKSMHWSRQVRSHYRSSSEYSYDEKLAKKMRSQGFVMTHTMSDAGIFRGYGSIVKLADDIPSKQIISADISQGLSFRTSRELGRSYPTSVMGAIALMRQSFYDATWYEQINTYWQNNPGSISRPEYNPALAELSKAVSSNKPFIIESFDEQWILRAHRLAKEFDLNIWVVGSGHEYKRIPEVKQTGIPLIIPVAFPGKPDAKSPEVSLNLSLQELRHWYFATQNLYMLEQAGLSFAVTSYGLSNQSDFLKNIRNAVKQGFSEEKALASLTTIPAKMLGIDELHGSIAKGKSACFFISDGSIFDKSSDIMQVWVQGKKHVIKEEVVAEGIWELSGMPFEKNILKINKSGNQLSAKLTSGLEETEKELSDVSWSDNRLSFTIEKDSIYDGFRLSASVYSSEMLGVGKTSNSEFFSWMAKRTSKESDNNRNKDSGEKPRKLDLPLLYPAMEYGIESKPAQPDYVLVKNAIIWTQGERGVLEGYDMLVEKGKIKRIAKNIAQPNGAKVVDAQGRHVSPGLIDPHLHTSISGGVNEVGDAVVSETRIEDVLNANNVWIYRLLAGGLTTANLFHGSANPVGGQSAVIKMRWGSVANDLQFDGAKPGLKFALGENVKRTSGRYPDTRMGTEQIIKDAFLAALQYEKEKEAAKNRKRREHIPFRKDLQLEALLEVLKGKRLAHVHAYRQDEILMMMRLAEEFGFKVASFEHTVEGYKVAEELYKHGAAAVVWTDWSSFKFESFDAIHQNAKLLLDAGVLTSLHSDNTQLATRMNWEAGKTLRTGVGEVEAMNLITINPAKILQIDHRTGSLEEGKDADFVIWNGHPLSAYTTADQTWVDGRKYFDKEADAKIQEKIKNERSLLIQKILSK